MNTIHLTFGILAVVSAACFMGYHLPLILPQLTPIFDRKPFNCRPCFTFHSVWVGMTALAYLSDSLNILWGGIVLAFCIFFIVKYIDQKQIDE